MIQKQVAYALVAELAECRYSAVNPVVLWPSRRYVQHQDEVGGVPGGTEHAPASARLVDGTAVDRALPELGCDAGLEPDQRQGVVQDLWKRLVEHHVLTIPPSALNEQTLYSHRPQSTY